jgi:predicted transport protein
MYIGYKHGKNFCEVRIQTRAILIWLDIAPAELDDPSQVVRDVSTTGHYGTGKVEVKLTNSNQLDKVMRLVEQSFKQTV